MQAKSFYDELAKTTWSDVAVRVASKSSAEVKAVLSARSARSVDDFLALISPAAANYLPEMKKLSKELTQRRFGNTVQMYIPLYLSNECTNICTYCGFSVSNKIDRLTLDDAQIESEIRIIKQLGFDHVLVVTGESARTVDMKYFKNALSLLRPHFSNIAFEVQPLDELDYQELSREGVHTVLVYQETYNEENYRLHHPRGKKSNFRYRLETPERLGRAGMHKIGLGFLIGLEDWRCDAGFLAMHLAYLRKRYWKTRFSVSFPRLRPAEGLIEPKSPLNEIELEQLICAFRIFDENLELSLSTRESPAFRDQAVTYGITSISAGSRTEPGGYTATAGALRQFEIDDNRSPKEVEAAVRARGYEVVWKDWDRVYSDSSPQIS